LRKALFSQLLMALAEPLAAGGVKCMQGAALPAVRAIARVPLIVMIVQKTISGTGPSLLPRKWKHWRRGLFLRITIVSNFASDQ
jgi:hypothetical protein